MADHPGWYPASQVCYPPELPEYLKNVYDLKPIAGVPSDTDVIGIHSVVHAASRVSGVPGMHDSHLFLKLADHLFSVQMARYRCKYSLVTFPSDATYTPPALPALVSVNLETVSGAPSDEELTKVQDAVRAYQNFVTVPSVFDPEVNMKLSQHLFDLQMARHMRIAGETQPKLESRTSVKSDNPVGTVEWQHETDETMDRTNNVGTGGSEVNVEPTSGMVPGAVKGLMEQSNRLAERFNQLLERSNELMERSSPPSDQSNQLTEQLNRAIERFDQLMEQLAQSSTRSNELAQEANKHAERFGDIVGNINRVLVGIQHAIVRNHKGNTENAMFCLVNETGEALGISRSSEGATFRETVLQGQFSDVQIYAKMDGERKYLYVKPSRLGECLRFFGIDEGLCVEETSATVIEGKQDAAQARLIDYLYSCLG
ncbi:hypothetical protein RSOLAG22IIIB_07244 [Rhizoctonia solani]|uniref:Laminin domain protein n=1 Tax=Rhizoctonia solani TaxID=456999 RepID=A0A0K6FLR0_9AGAM|nr:hypothetical protein RSOLAG22IIIB_07244 [Rhizoctonia solani]